MTTLADIKRPIELVQDADAGIPAITQVVISNDGVGLIQLREGQWIKGRFDRNIRLDQAANMQGDGQPRAHIYGRKGDELVVVNLDGSVGHGAKGRLHPDDAAALVAKGYTIPANHIIEWWSLNSPAQVLFGWKGSDFPITVFPGNVEILI